VRPAQRHFDLWMYVFSCEFIFLVFLHKYTKLDCKSSF
jgi:hypothetical protein